jgi:hypothetical protein
MPLIEQGYWVVQNMYGEREVVQVSHDHWDEGFPPEVRVESCGCEVPVRENYYTFIRRIDLNAE